jgi:endonuclease YncB( thermonuclease family)
MSHRLLIHLLRALIISLTLTSTALAEEFTGKIVSVSEGDLLTLLHKGKPERVRLHGIDCPERRQPFGKQAKRFTSQFVYGKTVTVTVFGLNRSGQAIGEVSLSDGRVLNQELLKAGLAWWDRKSSDASNLGALEAEAREVKRGLWDDPNPIPPWKWRTAKKSR